MNPPVAQGDVLAGKYRVERVLGVGGMGVVVCARHMQLDALVALKFMRPEAVEDKDAVGRFLREARAAARLRGEHIARVTDVGTLDSGAPYLVMEYLDGKDLAASLAEGRPSVPQAVEYVVQVCEALEEAHSRGIVHRDIKPSNLFLTKKPNGQPSIKVLDFGISKLAPDGSSGATSANLNATSTKAVFGSPLYMAPEQMRSAAKVDARADVWSLGATLYELLGGRVPFLAESLMDLCLKVAQEPPHPLRELRPEVPVELEAIVARCLAKDPADRFASVADLALVLTPYAVKRRPSMVDDDVAGETEPVPVMTGAAAPLTSARVSDAPLPEGDSRLPHASPAHSTQKSSEVAVPAVPVPPAVPAQPLPVSTAANWGNTGVGSTKGSRGRAVWLAGGGVVLAAAVAAFVATRDSSHASPSASAASQLPPPAPSVVVAPAITTLPSAATSLAPLEASPSDSASASAAAAPSPAPSPVASAPAPVSRPRTVPAARSAAPAALPVEPAPKRTPPKAIHDPYANPN